MYWTIMKIMNIVGLYVVLLAHILWVILWLVCQEPYKPLLAASIIVMATMNIAPVLVLPLIWIVKRIL